jgi:hypothetical protein
MSARLLTVPDVRRAMPIQSAGVVGSGLRMRIIPSDGSTFNEVRRDDHPSPLGGSPRRACRSSSRGPPGLIAKDPDDFTLEERAEFDVFVADVFNRMNAAREEIHGKD